MTTIEWQGKTVEIHKTMEWQGHKLKIMQEIIDPKYGQVLNTYVDDIKKYIVNDEIVTDQDVIDYLDDHYGRPVKWRNILF